MKNNALPKTPMEAAERLSLITLALESSLLEGRMGESEALFAERDQCLDQIEGMTLDEAAREKLEAVGKIDKRILAMLQTLKQGIADELNLANVEKRATRSFAGYKGTASSFEQAG